MLNTDLERCTGRNAPLRGGAWRRLVHGLVLGLLVVSGSIVAALPADVILVLDNSGSMRSNDPQFLLKPAVNGFVTELDSETRVGMIIFDHKVHYAVPLGPLDPASREALGRSLEGIDYRGQFTDSPAAIERAIYALKANGREDVARVIVFMTDGIVDTGNAGIDAEKAAWLRDELATDAANNDIRIFGIAFTDEADFFLIQSLAKKTEGEYFRAPRPEQLADVFATIQQRLAAPPVSARPGPAPAPMPAVEPAVEPVADKPPPAAAPAT
ncbi:MAG: vWA domain-containing protein, partial [Gammaproteobacteria bacterium]